MPISSATSRDSIAISPVLFRLFATIALVLLPVSIFVISTTVLRGKEFVAIKKPDIGSSPFWATPAVPSHGELPGNSKTAAKMIKKTFNFIKTP
jgi:hypothetical protein